MEFIFSKRQLKLNEFVDTSDNNSINNSKPALDVSNSENDNDPSSLRTDVEKIKQANPGKNPLAINTQSYTNKKLPTGNVNGKETANEEARDKSEKELDIKILEIPPNDYICNFDLRRGDDRITQLKFTTKKGKEFIVGSDEGEEMKVDFINDNKDYMILYLFGGYRKCLECIAAGYIPLKSYLGGTMGYFELKRKVKDEKFKNAIQAKLNELSESDKILFRVCCLPDACFNSIIKFCLM